MERYLRYDVLSPCAYTHVIKDCLPTFHYSVRFPQVGLRVRVTHQIEYAMVLVGHLFTNPIFQRSLMNAVGIDVSKGKSTVAILRPGREVVASPFEVSHNPKELNELVTLIKSLDGDSKILMEYTGNYYLPVALFLRKSGLFVSAVNPILVKDYSNKSFCLFYLTFICRSVICFLIGFPKSAGDNSYRPLPQLYSYCPPGIL